MVKSAPHNGSASPFKASRAELPTTRCCVRQPQDEPRAGPLFHQVTEKKRVINFGKVNIMRLYRKSGDGSDTASQLAHRPPLFSASNLRRTSSLEMSADQPYAAATAASRAACASASHCGRAL